MIWINYFDVLVRLRFYEFYCVLLPERDYAIPSVCLLETLCTLLSRLKFSAMFLLHFVA